MLVLVRPSASRLSIEKMLVGEGRNLWKMGDAEHLLAAAEGLQFLTDGLGRAAADADVNFVEDQCARGGKLLFRLDRALFHADLERQHHARHFAARGNLMRAA